ncbi:16S rRNA (cytidine(1402)-2'-O)-methyltransferase [Nitrosospira sp. Nl5]|uniref:16S rRNA (cytidine(1402)-2'-O)-methyltransferase n=1 Tax=Nitrosospira sp. Nl5 TaxID=200120 RepID=UPI000B806C85|nr:16S rRNA (cytidine(1402)-2'-O)-methyltransferase [Nitrosospira sp. Nl5]
MIPGTLYIVATPIGNLRDISLRALDVLAAVDVIAAEDTRTTSHLLAHHGLIKKMMSLHQHNERATAKQAVNLLACGKSVALVTDAGTPGNSDPGSILVALAREQGYKVVPIPGANAAVCALSASGIAAPHYLFYGFLPPSAGPRRRELEQLKSQPYTLVFYEAPHRILECVAILAEVLGIHRQLTIARELTKLFETIHSCSLGDAIAWLQADVNRQKGEFVLLLSGAEPAAEGGISDKAQHTLTLLLRDLPLKQAVRLATEITGESKNMLYARALALKEGTGS